MQDSRGKIEGGKEMNEQNKNPNKSLRSGERQIRNSLEKMEYWQKWRYEEALKYIDKNNNVLDLGCGCGSGSFILSKKAKQVTGVDDSQETIDYAKRCWKAKNIEYHCMDALQIKESFDVVTAFEIIEHIKDTENMFKKLGEITKSILILSVPHISAPLENKFHWKHFTEKEVRKYIINVGFKVERIETLRFGRGLAVFCMARREEEVKKGIVCPCGKMITGEEWKKRGIYKTTTYNEEGRIIYQECFHNKVIINIPICFSVKSEKEKEKK